MNDPASAGDIAAPAAAVMDQTILGPSAMGREVGLALIGADKAAAETY